MAYPTADDAYKAQVQTNVAVYDGLWDAAYFLLLIGFTIGNVYMMMSLLTAEIFGILSFGSVYGVVSLAGQLGSGIGLVFTLFFAVAVMPLGVLLLQLKLGALVTIAGSALAFVAARVLRVGRFALVNDMSLTAVSIVSAVVFAGFLLLTVRQLRRMDIP